ncbi:MAG: hypothetical protein GX803_02675 [Lentisphaerae bacterium]|nr:hypothetical protein [Lentisphaerota bacterium]
MADPLMELIAGSFLLTARVALAGGVWAGGGGGWLARMGRVLALGVLLNLLAVVALASLEAWSPAADWALWALVVLGGVLWAFKREADWRPLAGRAAQALVLVWALTAIPLCSPPRSEWLAGGWDPGIYQNNAVAVARQGGLQARVDSIYADMTEEERVLLSTAEDRYREILPGVPVRTEDGSLPVYFFHLTSLCGAWFLRMGGVGLLVRLPAILALWGLIPLLALGDGIAMGGWRRWLVLACWLLAPLWWYHQSLPTSEMLYQLLLLGGALLYAQAAGRGARMPLGAMAALFAATINHLNVAALATIILVVAAFVEGGAGAPGRRERIGWCFAAIGLAIAWNLSFAGVTVTRLEDKDQALRVIMMIVVGGAALSWAFIRQPLPAEWRARSVRWILLAAAAVSLLLALMGLASVVTAFRPALFRAVSACPLVGRSLSYLCRVIPFQGPLTVVWAGLGLAWLFWKPDPSMKPARIAVLGLGMVCLSLFWNPRIAAVYPWALRRIVVFWVPLLALGQAAAVLGLVQLVRARGGGRWWLVLLVLAPAAGQSFGLSRAAARVGDYRGLTATLAAVASRLEPGDLVVADAALWGTPLMLAEGHDVLNGELLWKSRNAGTQRDILRVVRRAQERNSRRALWLTSTEHGRGIYPFAMPGAVPLMEPIRYAYPTVIHSRRGNRFAVQDNEKVFQLWIWTPPEGWPADSGAED